MFWIVNQSTEEFIACFDDQRCQIDSSQCWLEVPEGLARGNVKVLNTEDVLSLVEDTSKPDTNPYWKALRAERDRRLLACDWTQLSDCPLETSQKEAWTTLRQALRDIPENTSDPEAVIWPVLV